MSGRERERAGESGKGTFTLLHQLPVVWVLKQVRLYSRSVKRTATDQTYRTEAFGICDRNRHGYAKQSLRIVKILGDLSE